MAIIIDGVTKRIILDSTNVSAAEIWTAWVNWHADNNQWPLAFSLVGGISLGSGLFIPPYFFLLSGWRVRPMEADHTLTITGNLFVDGGGTPVVRTLGPYQVNVNYTVPVQAQGIATSGSTSSGPTAEEIWSYMDRTLTAGSGSGPTAAEIRQEMDSNSVKLIQIKALIESLDIPTATETSDAVWNKPVADLGDKTTIGGWINKMLLTVPKFLGLK
jgi:hypothetical protein